MLLHINFKIEKPANLDKKFLLNYLKNYGNCVKILV